MLRRIALLDACMLACDQCFVLSRVSHVKHAGDVQAGALDSGRKRGGLRRRRQWPYYAILYGIVCRRCRDNQPEDGGSIQWGTNDGMAAKEIMASDRRGLEDQDMAGGKLCGWHRPFVQN